MQSETTTPYGYCQCGCGERTRLAPYNHSKAGWIKGRPTRYVNGHNGRLSAVEYVVEDRDHETPCWIWQGSRNPQSGHAAVSVGRGRQKKTVGAHRVYYERAHGPVPEGMHLHHRCEVPACVNPDHLEPLSVAAHRQAHGKLDWEKVGRIRELWARGGIRQADIGAMFGVTQAAVSLIVRNEQWVVLGGADA